MHVRSAEHQDVTYQAIRISDQEHANKDSNPTPSRNLIAQRLDASHSRRLGPNDGRSSLGLILWRLDLGPILARRAIFCRHAARSRIKLPPTGEQETTDGCRVGRARAVLYAIDKIRSEPAKTRRPPPRVPATAMWLARCSPSILVQDGSLPKRKPRAALWAWIRAEFLRSAPLGRRRPRERLVI